MESLSSASGQCLNRSDGLRLSRLTLEVCAAHTDPQDACDLHHGSVVSIAEVASECHCRE